MNIYSAENFGFAYPFSKSQINLQGSFSINQGDCILIQGNSGSGKSTLMTALKGLIPQHINGTLTGTLLFKQQSISELNPLELMKIGYLQQNPDSQIICADVYSELAFGLENQGYTAEIIADKINARIEHFNLKHLLNRKIATLSGGEKQKINLVAILLLEPEVILLDEPTAFLDPDSAMQIISIIREYIQNKTLIIIEHNLHYLQNLVNRCIKIDKSGVIHEIEITSINWLDRLPRLYPSNQQSVGKVPLLELKNLSFSYPNADQLFNKLNLQIHSGEIIAIRGQNGCGKSTLLKIIAKLIPSTQQLFWQNQDISKLKTHQYWQEISLVWQNPEAHFIHSSVALEVNDAELLAQLNLASLKRHNPFNLSEGQKRRLSIAINLSNLQQTKLLLLDEPTFGQDFNNRLILAQKLTDLAQKGLSIVIVSHDDEFIRAITQNRYTLLEGKLIPWKN